MANNAHPVPLDLIVRDKHGRNVRDLRPDEILITEDGTPLKIKTLQLETAGQPGAEQQPRLISIVLDGSDEAANDVGREALLEISKQLGPSNGYISVWRIRGRLSLVQGFTEDETALKEAVETATRTFSEERECGKYVWPDR